MSSETLVKCAHPPCQCLVEAEQKFCSANCENADGSARVPCLCDHDGCVGEYRLGKEENEADILNAD